MNASEHAPPPADADDRPAEVSADGDSAAEQPAKRRRAPRKPKAMPTGEAAVASAADDAAPSGAERGERGERAAGAEGDTARMAADTAPRGRADADAGAERGAEQGAEQGVQQGAEPGAEPGAVDSSTGAEPRSGRRGRNRRRGRRGGERRADGSGPQDANAPRAEGEAADADDESDRAGAALAEGETTPPGAAAEPPPQPEEVFAEVLSGAFDAAQPAEGELPPVPPKRVLAPEPDAPKLHKVLAQAGLGSRRDLEQMIAEGRLAVNGQPAHTGQRISFGDRVTCDGKPVRFRIAPPPARVLAYHKPAGEVVTHDDPQQRPTVFRRLPRLPQGKWQSVGRLDINTEGLLLFTNSGELANQLMHPRFGVEREYAVRSLGMLSEEHKAQLLEGVEVEGQRAAFKSITDGGGEGANHWYRVVITEGRNREVRRLFEAVGHAVSRLIRIRYGSVVLPRGLRRGVWVDLPEGDVRALRRLAQPPRPEGDDASRPERDGEHAERGDRSGRRGRKRRGGDRPPRAEGPPPRIEGPRAFAGAEPRVPDFDDHDDHDGHEHIDGAAIPNPLQQTFDRRAIQQARSQRREIGEDGPIPNPLQQTYDKRALHKERQPQREIPEDGPIPNPLQQTYDKRFVQGGGGFGTPFGKPGKPGGGKSGKGGKGGPGGPGGPFGGGKPRRGKGGGVGGGPGGKAGGARGGSGGAVGGGAGGGQPDPMRTSVGYIGADAFLRKGGRGGKPGGGRGGGGRPR